MTNLTNKLYPVFRLDVTNALLARGYSIEYVRKNYSPEHESSVVFMFEDRVTQDIVNDCVKNIELNYTRRN